MTRNDWIGFAFALLLGGLFLLCDLREIVGQLRARICGRAATARLTHIRLVFSSGRPRHADEYRAAAAFFDELSGQLVRRELVSRGPYLRNTKEGAEETVVYHQRRVYLKRERFRLVFSIIMALAGVGLIAFAFYALHRHIT